MPNVTIRVDGLDRVQRRAAKMQESLSDFRPTLDKSADAFYAHVARIFDTEGSAGSGKWEPLSPKRLHERTKPGSLGKPAPILDYYGNLREAATSNEVVNEYGVTGGQRFTNRSVELTLKGDKVRNNDGFKRGKFDVPAREFWPFDSAQQDIVFEPFEKWANDWLFGRL